MDGSHRGQDPAAVAVAKDELRQQVITARRDRGALDEADRIAAHALSWSAVRDAGTVAAYVSVGREPGTLPLLDALLAAGKRVLLPVLLPDNDLDWGAHAGPTNLVQAERGLLEPAGARLGADAIRTADVVLVPGLAVSPSGARLGRGGGSYDRALARVAAAVPVAVVVYAEELGLAVPTEPHDRPVTHALTPDGVAPLVG